MHIVLIVLVAVALTQMAVLITSIYLHRGLAHRSLVLHPVAELGCRTLLWLTTGQCRQAPDLAEDRLDRVVFSHGGTGLALGTGALCLTLGPGAGLAAMVVHAGLYVFVLAPLISGLGHWQGRQPFGNSACNIRLLSFVTGGESLHNNHHADPRAARFSMAAREVDPSRTVIRMPSALRVVRVHDVAVEAS